MSAPRSALVATLLAVLLATTACDTGDGKELRLRGINAKVVVPGPIATGDEVRKLQG